MRNEKAFSVALREKCTSEKVNFWTFENCGYKDVPDLYSVSPGLGVCWIELKIVPTIKSKIPFRSGQQQWLRNHALKGGVGFVMIYVQNIKMIYLFKIKPTSFIVSPLFKKDVQTAILSSPITQWNITDAIWGGVARWFQFGCH